MKIIVKRELDKDYFVSVIKDINKNIRIPKKVNFYIVDKKSDCNPIIKNLPLRSRKELVFLDTLRLFERTPKEFLKAKNVSWREFKTDWPKKREGKRKIYNRLSRDLFDLSFRSDDRQVQRRIGETYGFKKFVNAVIIVCECV